MTTAVEVARDYAQRYPLLIALGSILAIPGGFLLFSDRTTLLPKEPFLSESASSSTFVPGSTATSPICTVHDSFVFEPAISRPVDEPVTAIIYRLISSTRNAVRTVVSRSGGRHHPKLRHGTPEFAFGLPLSIVIIAALPSAFVFSLRQLPISWATRHQTLIANVLHSLTIFFCAKYGFEAYHLLLLVFVMVAFDLFQQAVSPQPTGTTIPIGESGHSSQQTSPLETQDTETCSTPANAGTVIAVTRSLLPNLAQKPHVSDTALITFDAKDREIVRLQRALTELKTTHKATEVQLRIAREELFNARETLNGTFAEYANLREELKIIKQNLGRDHQAIVYRKDIELFALRKGNEQKDQHIRERDAKIEDMARQHKAAIEVKDAQLRLMKERIVSIERQSSPRPSEEGDDGDQALEVRLLRVRKGRNSPVEEEDKDLIIAKLQEKLAGIPATNEEVVNHRAELSRAWDVAKKIKKALLEEREKHCQTQEKLQEATVKLSEADSQLASHGNHSFSRLPTIEENDHDKNELEAMFNTTQEDNIRLCAEVTALEKRLADANSRMFTAIQEAEALREGSSMEKTSDQDAENARPSLVHQVHFQRMEVQLTELRRALKAKEELTKKLTKTIADKDQHINDIQAELDAAASFHTQDQDEIERLKQIIAELQATKYQLMLDRERLVMHRPRQRIISSERTDRTSARSSGATLIQELSAPSTAPSEDGNSPAPVTQDVEMPEREGSIQQTPKRHLRAKSLGKELNNRWSLISQDLPPPELRETKGVRSKSKSFKDVLQKMVGNKSQESHVRRALASRDSNAPIRPLTAASMKPAKPINQATPTKMAISPLPQNVRPATAKPKPKTLAQQQRYYATQDAATSEMDDSMRPQSVGAGSTRKPKSIYNWSATRKLKRRSLM